MKMKKSWSNVSVLKEKSIKEREESMATGKALDGKPSAGNPHVRFDEGEVAPATTPRRGSLFYKTFFVLAACAAGLCGADIVVDDGETVDLSVAGDAASAVRVRLDTERKRLTLVPVGGSVLLVR